MKKRYKAARKLFDQVDSCPFDVLSNLRTLVLITLGIVVLTLVVALIALGLSISAYSKSNEVEAIAEKCRICPKSEINATLMK